MVEVMLTGGEVKLRKESSIENDMGGVEEWVKKRMLTEQEDEKRNNERVGEESWKRKTKKADKLEEDEDGRGEGEAGCMYAGVV